MLDTSIAQREYSYNEIVNFLFSLQEKYNFVKVVPIGKTILGRTIYAVKIGMVDYTVLYAAGFHASERLTTLSMLIFLERFADSLQNNTNFSISSARNALFGKSVFVVPVVNPDGYEIARAGAATAGNQANRILEIANGTDLKYWNANARGIDINHNFNAGFDLMKQIERNDGIFGPSPRRYGGEAPESEPETQALLKLVRDNYIAQVIAWHSQGEEIYWQYGDSTPEKSYLLAQLFGTASGYAVADPAPNASHAGFKDWFIEDFGRPGFTIEIGKGMNPLPATMLHEIYGGLEELILISIALA